MNTDYVSVQTVEVCGPDDSYNETEFVIGLKCTAPSDPGSFNPYDGGWPPEGPEFELTSIQVPVLRVNRKDGESEYLAPLEISWAQFVAVLGEEVADKVYERAVTDATENGEF